MHKIAVWLCLIFYHFKDVLNLLGFSKPRHSFNYIKCKQYEQIKFANTVYNLGEDTLYKIVKKANLNNLVTLMSVEAPYIARKARAGQFIILRVDEKGERIPFTISDYDVKAGTVTIIFQIVGHTTKLLSEKQEGDYILDLTGPLGKATDAGEIKKVCVVGGGVGCAIAYPQAKQLYSGGAYIDIIAGFRSRDIVILEDEMKKVCDNLYITTDDGSYGEKGFVTQKLKSLLDSGINYDLVIAIGPVIMMKMISQLTVEYNVKTLASLNPIMIDGTGMCGGCRVTVGGEIKFACVDGPDFDAHKVDFDELAMRNQIYKEEEQCAFDNHKCRLGQRTAYIAGRESV